MVFGIVAIATFMETTFDMYLDDVFFPYCVTYLTCVDVLMSFAACSLIGLGALYAWMWHRTSQFLQRFEGDAHSDTVIPKMGNWTPMIVNQQSVLWERHELVFV
ncbi:unnamed protein product [Prorocentrum cordatum]|uniref:Uncharacterized protein n=1 Tax=Prorocentrum cordatum TaxID=2364126 RepID=A0ABN9VME9_9DINO|nr:unnamed protein product [Polarella glacialis]